jgi:hypothetical protein
MSELSLLFFLQVYMYKVSLKERIGPVKYEFI